jgi:hypothetical protein
MLSDGRTEDFRNITKAPKIENQIFVTTKEENP